MDRDLPTVSAKTIRNCVRKHDPAELVMQVVSKLRQVEFGDVHVLRTWRPWDLLLLAKWAIAEGGLSATRRPANDHSLPHLMNLLHQHDGSHPIWSSTDSERAAKFVRVIGNQQFWLQRDVAWDEAGRLSLIYLEGSQSAQWLPRVASVAGMDLRSLMLCLIRVAAYLRLRHAPLWLEPQVFLSLAGDHDTAEAVSRRYSRTLIEYRHFLASRSGAIRDYDLQIVERSPLPRYPFVRLGERFLPFSARVTDESFRVAAYDLIKETGSQDALNAFAGQLEDYVATALADAGVPSLRERDIRRRIGRTGRVTDFAVPLPGVCLLIEVKSVEVSGIARANPSDAVLSREFSGSIAKAVEQGAEFAARVQVDGQLLPELCELTTYLLVVTAKDLHLGIGSTLVRELGLSSKIAELSKGRLRAEHVAVVSLRDLDAMMGAVEGGNLDLARFLEHCASLDSDPRTAAYDLSMHLRNFGDSQPRVRKRVEAAALRMREAARMPNVPVADRPT